MKPCAHPAEGLEILFPARDYVTGDPFEIRRCTTAVWRSPGRPRRRRRWGATTRTPTTATRARSASSGPWRGCSERSTVPGPAWWRRQSGGRPGRVLDVGCGRGFLLDAFRRRGWTVEGTEMSAASSAHAREVLGIPVHVGPLESLDLPAESFDAVTLWHVLEHVTYARLPPRRRSGGSSVPVARCS